MNETESWGQPVKRIKPKTMTYVYEISRNISLIKIKVLEIEVMLENVKRSLR